MPFNIGPGEFIALAVLALILFGPKKLPQFGKTIGESIGAFKKAMNGEPDKTEPEPSSATPAQMQPATPAQTQPAAAQSSPATVAAQDQENGPQA